MGGVETDVVPETTAARHTYLAESPASASRRKPMIWPSLTRFFTADGRSSRTQGPTSA